MQGRNPYTHCGVVLCIVLIVKFAPKADPGSNRMWV